MDAAFQDEERLARAVMAGGVERGVAERALCERLAPRVRLFALRRLRCDADAADVTQETLRVVVSSLREGKVNDIARISGFALSTGRHLIARLQRGERVRRELRDSLDEPEAVHLESELWSIDMRTLARCMSKLADRDMRVVGMTFYDDRSAEEISNALGLTTANVRVIRHRALLQLRGCVDGESDGAS